MTPTSLDKEREQVLVVDDDLAMCRAVTRVLGSRYSTTTALSIEDARELLGTLSFDLALIDIQLTDGDGYSLCQEIREHGLDTEVILMTGSVSHTDEKLYRSLEEGAFYFLLKPFERRVLQALVERCLRLRSERRVKERYAATLAEDLESARRFQASLIPTRPLATAGWRLEGRCNPCDALGGDFFFYQTEASRVPGTIMLAICDIVGHGVKAAMYAGMVRSILVSALRRNPDPEPVLAELASSLDFFEPEAIVTMVYGTLDADGVFTYFNAGHPPLLLQRRDRPCQQLASTGALLSSGLANLPRGVDTQRLEPGDRLVTYTDGILEAQNPTGAELELDGLIQALEQARSKAASDTLEHALEALETHCSGRPLEDDTTLLVIDRLGG